MIAVTQTYPNPTSPNRHAVHDLGLAISQMVLQALDHGVYTHQMGGFFPEKAREVYQIPEGFEPYTAIAMGYPRSAWIIWRWAPRARGGA